MRLSLNGLEHSSTKRGVGGSSPSKRTISINLKLQFYGRNLSETCTSNKCLQFKAKDGKVFDNKETCERYEQYLNGNGRICEKCNGKGIYTIPGHYIENLMSFFPHKEWIETKTVTCGYCKGTGYQIRKIVWE